MRKISLIVIHCSATRADRDFTAKDVDTAHRFRGFSCWGYHYYIRKSGQIEPMRDEDTVGAHARGFNAISLGVCYEGGLDENGRPTDTRTTAQRFALLDLLTILKHQYPEAQIAGHYQLSATIHKACPCYDPRKEYSEL
jgi:N-acetylmuramoyl-L-alanine amidase